MNTPNRGAYGPPRVLSPDQVRRTTFARTWRGFGGYAPDEVREHLSSVATTMEYWQDLAQRRNEENARLKAALQQWQSLNADQRFSNEAGGRHAMQAPVPPTGAAVQYPPAIALVREMAQLIHEDWMGEMRGHGTSTYYTDGTQNRMVPFANLSEAARRELLSTTHALLGALPPTVQRVLVLGLRSSQGRERGPGA
jgi:DivIVA domain-containing protein